QIRTFHSWFGALLRSAPLAVLEELGLPASYELLEEDAEAVRLVWRRFHAALTREGGEAARGDFEAVVATHGRSQTRKALESALARRVEFALADAQGTVDHSVRAFGEQFPEFAGLAHPQELLSRDAASRQTLLAAAAALGRGGAPAVEARGSALEQAIAAGDFDGQRDALLTQKDGPRKFSDKLAGIDAVRAAQELLLRVIEAGAQHEAWLYQQRMARLARVLIDQFGALKRDRGWVDMNDVERAALFMLSDPVLSGWVQERLDARVRHLRIEEFQDTNPLPWQALYAWLGGYAGAGRAPSVFIVGDPKQSIYRFRRAEPQVFRAAKAFVADGLGGDLLSCDHTRRNAPAVIEVVNKVMDAAQQAGDYDGFRPHSTESGDAGVVACMAQVPRGSDKEGPDPGQWRDTLTTPREIAEETPAATECRQAAQWLAARMAQGLQPKEVLVLARRRERLSVMQDELRRLHIPAQQPEKSALIDAPEAQDIAALLDALVSTRHDLSLARALRSPLFGASDADLAALALRRRGTQASWFELLTAQPPDGPAHAPDGAQASARIELPPLSRAAQVLPQWKQWIDTLPPHDALDAIFHDGDVLARFAAAAPAALRPSVLDRLRALLGAALAVDGGRFATPYGFLRALKAGDIKAPPTEGLDAVRLLTVHGAKGLEAQVVLILDTDNAERNAETMSVLVDWPGEAAAPLRFTFLASESRPSACAVQALAVERQARQREEINALYVAMTRARQELLITSVQPHRANGASWWQRITPWCEPLAPSPDAHQRQTAQDSQTQDAVQAAVTFDLLVLPEVNGPGLQGEPAVAQTPLGVTQTADDDSIESLIGRAMHRLLEWAPLGASDSADTQLQAVARDFGLSAAQSQLAADMARRILRGAGAWAWDAQHIDWHANEIELVHQSRILRLDRLVRRRQGAEWWVLDYKSALRPDSDPALLAQLQGYRAAVQALHPGQAVKAAFLTPRGDLIEIDD
ncbi:MAG: 3'-5' exonuclease, partial [Burkholderiaceae bacterium]|nr:3'-5' exonuclease [Burkholderiaceae bacterium]